MFRLIAVVALLGCALAAVIESPYSDTGRIVGGEPADIEDFPYQVALIMNGKLCGGSLLSKTEIVTAAHCLQSLEVDQIKVRLGSSYFRSGGELVSASAFKFHEKYDEDTTMYDVGVIRLSTPVRFTDKIQPIALATKEPKTGTPAVVSGWGSNVAIIGSAQSVLHEVEVKIVERRDCASPLYKYGEQVKDTMICAAVEGGGKDACQGDSGGPLAVDDKLVGIVSWGNLCARKNYPGVYASVPELRPWIEKTIQELSKL